METPSRPEIFYVPKKGGRRQGLYAEAAGSGEVLT